MDWNNAKSIVATSEGLQVEESDGTLGAKPRPGFRAPPPGRQTNFDPPPSQPLGCADSALKTYRSVIGRTTNFKACSDNDAWELLTGGFTYEFKGKLQRLEAKPGYISVWVDVPAPLKG